MEQIERFFSQYKKVIIWGNIGIGTLLVVTGIMGLEIGGKNATTFYWDVFIPISIVVLFICGVLELLLKKRKNKK